MKLDDLTKAQRQVLRMLTERPRFTLFHTASGRIAGSTALALARRGLACDVSPPGFIQFAITDAGRALLTSDAGGGR